MVIDLVLLGPAGRNRKVERSLNSEMQSGTIPVHVSDGRTREEHRNDTECKQRAVELRRRWDKSVSGSARTAATGIATHKQGSPARRSACLQRRSTCPRRGLHEARVRDAKRARTMPRPRTQIAENGADHYAGDASARYARGLGCAGLREDWTMVSSHFVRAMICGKRGPA